MTSALTKDQLVAFLNYIGLSSKYTQDCTADLDTLSTLQLSYICAVPYENLGLHYSKDAKIALDVQTIYKKCTNNGRGGYCMENGIFFNHFLTRLGFQAYLTGARARPRVNGVPKGDFTGWMHVVNIVTLCDGSKYMVDVGFGGDLAVRPLPLVSGLVSLNFGTQEVRLIYDHMSQLSSGQKLWIYQYRNDPASEWTSAFCFSEIEFLKSDIEVMNFHTSQDPRCFQTSNLLVVKFSQGDEGISGKLMLVNNEVKENVEGKTRLIGTLRNELERVKILNDLFHISLSAEEASGIMGRNTELLTHS